MALLDFSDEPQSIFLISMFKQGGAFGSHEKVKQFPVPQQTQQNISPNPVEKNKLLSTEQVRLHAGVRLGLA